jgi:hypothetical protein
VDKLPLNSIYYIFGMSSALGASSLFVERWIAETRERI